MSEHAEASLSERNSMCLGTPLRGNLQGQPYLRLPECMFSVNVYAGHKAFFFSVIFSLHLSVHFLKCYSGFIVGTGIQFQISG